MGYETPHTKFLKVHVAMPSLVPTLKRIMEQGVNLMGQAVQFQPFECNVPFVLRYMVDNDIAGAGWLTLPKQTYQIRRDRQQTHCQVR
jgi:DNA polymerase delta subunit 1